MAREFFYPDANLRPHVHVHKGGATFKGHNGAHKDLEDGNGQRDAAINDVLNNVLPYEQNKARAEDLIRWIRERYGM